MGYIRTDCKALLSLNNSKRLKQYTVPFLIIFNIDDT